MKKVEMSARGLKVLRDQAKERLASESLSNHGARIPMDGGQRDDLRTAIREADERLARAEAEGGG